MPESFLWIHHFLKWQVLEMHQAPYSPGKISKTKCWFPDHGCPIPSSVKADGWFKNQPIQSHPSGFKKEIPISRVMSLSLRIKRVGCQPLFVFVRNSSLEEVSPIPYTEKTVCVSLKAATLKWKKRPNTLRCINPIQKCRYVIVSVSQLTIVPFNSLCFTSCPWGKIWVTRKSLSGN